MAMSVSLPLELPAQQLSPSVGHHQLANAPHRLSEAWSGEVPQHTDQLREPPGVGKPSGRYRPWGLIGALLLSSMTTLAVPWIHWDFRMLSTQTGPALTGRVWVGQNCRWSLEHQAAVPSSVGLSRWQ